MIALLVAAGVAAVAALIGTKVLIGWLGARAVHQPILSTSEGGPGHEAKAGTPTMGGMAIVGSACVGYAVAHLRSGVIFTRTGLFVMLAMIGAGVVGFLDDWIKVRNARNLGLNKRTKMIGLLVVSIGFAVAVPRSSRTARPGSASRGSTTPASSSATSAGRCSRSS